MNSTKPSGKIPQDSRVINAAGLSTPSPMFESLAVKISDCVVSFIFTRTALYILLVVHKVKMQLFASGAYQLFYKLKFSSCDERKGNGKTF